MSNLSSDQFTVPVYRGLKDVKTPNNPVGIHWSSKPETANHFARLTIPEKLNEVTRSVTLVGKVHPAAVVNPKSKEGKDYVSKFSILPNSNEQELTIRNGATILVDSQIRSRAKKFIDEQGMTQRETKVRKRNYNPPRQMTA